MQDSYYYFFSATAQVLASILALFGVFILFRIQSITSDLLDVCHKLEHQVTHWSTSNNNQLESAIRIVVFLMVERFQTETFNIRNVKKILELDSKNVLRTNRIYRIQKDKFDELHTLYKKLTTRTIDTSVLASILIVICLGILPFGKFLDSQNIMIYIMLLITILSAVVLWFLVSILMNAFDVKISLRKYFLGILRIVFYPLLCLVYYIKNKYEFRQFMKADAKGLKKVPVD